MKGEESVVGRAHWPTRPVWVLVESREEFGGDLPLLSLSAQAGVRERVEDEGRAASEDTSRYRVVRSGDLILNRLSARDGAYAISRVEGLVSPAYWVLRTEKRELDPRWLDYVLRATTYVAELGRISKFMPPAQFDLPWDQFRRLPIPMPAPSLQRAIANFLDGETARIDALITKKRRLIELSSARYRSALDQEFECASDSPVVALGRYVVSLTQGVSPQASNLPANEEEYGLLKLSAVKQGRYLPAENKALPAEFVVRPELVPRRGDLLVTRSNTPAYVGDACVVDEEARVVLCDLIYRIRMDARLDPRFAALALLRSEARRHLSSTARGTSQSMVKLRGEDIKATRIPLPPLQYQHRIVEEAKRAERRHLMLDERLRRQIELLLERRQALITAAVTGELEIPGVAA